MTKINDIQNAILQLDGGAYQKMMDSYLYQKFELSNFCSLGSQTGTNKPTKGIPDSYVRLENGKYIFIMYGTVNEASILKIKNDILSCLKVKTTEEGTKIAIEEIEQIICCFTTSNMTPAQNKELSLLFTNIRLIGISEVSQDLYYKYQKLAKDYLSICLDTDQILSSEDFVKKCGESVYATSLDMMLLGRENEKRDILLLLDQIDVILILGKSGVGKTRLALEVAKEYSKNNNYSVMCIKQNGEPLYEDIKSYFIDDKNYIILVDDANQLAHLGHLIDICIDSSRKHKVKLLLTVRDYAKENIFLKVRGKVNFENYELSLLKKDYISKILSEILGINNPYYLEKINEISNGNVRLAIIAGNCSKKGSFKDIQNAFDIYDIFFQDIISLMDKNELIVAALIAFFDFVKLDGNHIVYDLARIYDISITEFSEKCGELNEKEVVNLYQDMAAKFDEQNLGNYLQYYVFFKKKWFKPSEIITSLFPQYQGRITYSFSTIISLFSTPEIESYLRSEVQKVWVTFIEKDHETKKKFIESFLLLIEDEALQFLKNEIDQSTEKHIDFLNYDFTKGSNNHSISSDTLKSLCRYKHSDRFSDALDLIISLLKKNSEKPMDFYLAFKDYLSIDRHSAYANYSHEMIVVDKLLNAFQVSGTNEISVLLIQYTEEILKTEFQKFEEVGRNSINIFQFSIGYSSGSSELRNKCIYALINLYSVPELQVKILKSILKYQVNDPSPETFRTLVSDISMFEKFAIKCWNSSRFDECVVMHHLFIICKNNSVDQVEIFSRYMENKSFLQYLIISQDSMRTPNGYEENEREKRDNISQMIEQFLESDYDVFFQLLNNEYIGDGNDWCLSEGVSMLFQVLEGAPEKYIWATKGCLKNNTPHVCQPNHILRKVIEILGFQETELLLGQYDLTNDQLWTNCLLENAPDSSINKVMTDKIVRSLENNKEKERVYVLSLPLTVKIDKMVSGFAVLYLELLIRYFSQRPYILSNYLEQGLRFDRDNIDIISSFFFDDRGKKAIEDAYLLGLVGKTYFDSDHKIFLVILKEDYSFLEKVIKLLIKDYLHVEKDILKELWKLDDYSRAIEDSIELIHSNCQSHYCVSSTIAPLFRYEEKNNEIQTKQDKWLMEYITINKDDMNKIAEIFDVICNMQVDRKLRFILHFCQINSSYEAFKSIHLLPSSLSWSGSEVPLIEKKIAFLEALKKDLDGIKFIDHRVTLTERIRLQQEYKEKVLLDEFLNLD